MKQHPHVLITFVDGELVTSKSFDELERTNPELALSIGEEAAGGLPVDPSVIDEELEATESTPAQSGAPKWEPPTIREIEFAEISDHGC